MLVSTKHGVFTTPIDMSLRSYLLDTPKNPGQLIFSNPAKGIPSDQMIIPTGLGVADSKNNFYGTIGTGFSIEALTNKINMLTKKTGIKFILLNSELVYITSSIEVRKIEISSLIKLVKQDVKSLNFETDLEIKDIKFSYLKKADKYPFYIILGEDKSVSNARILSNILPRITELLFLGLICIILFYYSRKLLVKPIIELSQVAKKIANNEDQVIIPLIEYQEAQVLAFQLQGIQSMKNELVEARRSVEEVNAHLEQKVLERTSELQKALAAKTEFLNNMSHEIRTPILGFTSISEGLVNHWRDFDESKRLELASKVASNAKRLSRLVGHLLDLSKFTAGKMLLEFRQFDLNELVEAIIDEANALYLDGKAIEFEFTRSIPAKIIADEERIAQVLRNLVVNAIKFSNDNSQITVQLSNYLITYDNGKKQEAIHFAITDLGIGIPKDELEAIFAPFFISTRTKTKAGGTGLGLAIAREIIETHHGKIWAENNQKGGARFNFILPVRQAEQLDGHKNKIVAENDTQIINEPVSQKPATILMVDDEEICLTTMEMVFYGTNYKLIKAGGGREALEYLSLNPGTVDLIMLDLMMPDMYGLNVLSTLKSDPVLKYIPVILQTGTSEEEEIKKAYEMGVVAYIAKPYKKKIILELLSKIL